MARSLAIFLSAALVAGCTARVHDRADDMRLVQQLERNVALPDGAAPLAEYTRYYTFDNYGDLVGIYLLGAEGDRQVHVVKPREMPRYMDGGCSVINVRYDPEAGKVRRISCNGIA